MSRTAVLVAAVLAVAAAIYAAREGIDAVDSQSLRHRGQRNRALYACQLVQPCRAATAATRAVRIASTGPGRPVISSTCATAWYSSTVSPLTTGQPAARADLAKGVGHGAYTTSSTMVSGFQ